MTASSYKPGVTVVDYGLGNLHSVVRAFRAVGAEVETTSDPDRVAWAERLVIPGVGAFGDGMKYLAKRGLIEPVFDFASTGRPLLGICLGMQLLMSESEEFGHHQGLGLVPGRTVALPAPCPERRYKVPHVGWNELRPSGANGHAADWEEGSPCWDGTLLSGLRGQDQVYFVHSFAAIPEDEGHELAYTLYGGHRVSSVVKRDNIQGCQFHPEKSGGVGLRILRNFVAS